MEIEVNRFRLRIENKIVGYQKEIHKTVFYSKDQYGWNGTPIEFQVMDKFSGWYDKNRRAIYAEDILEFNESASCRFGAVVYDELLEKFQIFDLENEEFLSNTGQENQIAQPFVFKSYNFIQPNV